MLLAETSDSLSRLKTCASHVCGACFYDGSPNRARVLA
jgi:predicted RNA-binding Zn ribbon-like protein